MRQKTVRKKLIAKKCKKICDDAISQRNLCLPETTLPNDSFESLPYEPSRIGSNKPFPWESVSKQCFRFGKTSPD